MAQEGLMEENSEMSVIERISALSDKHASLEKSLHVEQKRPLPDVALVKNLKRAKLAIKDEIARLAPH